MAITVNAACPAAPYSVIVEFGTRALNSTERCMGQKDITKHNLSPGMTALFSINTNSVILEAGQDYCYFASLGVPQNNDSMYN